MKVNGSATLHAPRDQVWAALHDPAVLVRTIPGCLQLEEVGTHAYRMTIAAGVASIKGTYQGDVSLLDQDHPDAFTLRASGAGVPGTVQADVRVTLAEVPALDGGGMSSTRLDYAADAVVGGMIGGVGQRVLGAVAKKTAGEFFAAVDDALTRRVPATGSVPDGTVPAPRGEVTGPLEAAALTGGPASGRSAAALGVFRGPDAGSPSGEAFAFIRGACFGAAVALAGVLVGSHLTRRQVAGRG